MLRTRTGGTHGVEQSDSREARRLKALDRLNAVDAPLDPSLQRIVRLIRNIFDVPIASVSVLDGHRQLFKALDGPFDEQIPRRETFCNRTIESRDPTVIPDASVDPHFANSPFVLGEPHIRFYAGAPLRTADGQNIGTVCAIDRRPRHFTARERAILEDLAALAIGHMEATQLAAVDMLTGALSRRAFHTQGARALALARRHRYNLSLIAIDIDHFKAVNDTFGHAGGDTVLAAVAGTCARLLRASDLFGRVGGEEFAILLPHTDRAGALDVAERLRGEIEAMMPSPAGQPIRVTASFGVSTLDLSTRNMDGLLANADVALYRAKAAGRNRVVGWQGRPAGTGKPGQRRVLKAATIHFGDRGTMVDCTVRTLGPDGAGLDVAGPLDLPQRFHLWIQADGIDRSCRAVSQTERHVEVEFE